MKIAIVRGTFLTQYECQTFYPLVEKHKIVAFSSFHPYQDNFPFKVMKLPSPMDLNFGPAQRFKMPLLNRVFIDAHYLFGLENKLKGFDIVYCADSFYHYSAQCINAKKSGYVKKVIGFGLENIPFNNEGIWGRKEKKQYVLNNIDHFIAVTERTKACLVTEGYPENKISVIKQHIDINRFQPNNGKKFGSEQIKISFIGRLEYYKGVYETLYAANWLFKNESLKSFHLIFQFVGNGSEKEKLKTLSKRMGISDRVFFSNSSYEQMPKIYQNSDIIVAPSRPTKTWQEQFNTVLVEAQASGLPIVTTSSGGIPENVEDCALIANTGDFYSIAEKLKELILNPILRKELGNKARVHAVKNYDIVDGAKKIEAVFKNVLNE